MHRMTMHNEISEGDHNCPLDASAVPGKPDVTQEGPWKLYVTDGEGTWHSVKALRLVALTSDEVEELEAGDETVLDWCFGLSVEDALKAYMADHEDLHWT